MKNVEITCNSQSLDIFDFVKLRSHTNEIHLGFTKVLIKTRQVHKLSIVLVGQ